jgi:hypothetical protein
VADGIKKRHEQLANAPHQAPNIEPMIAPEAWKRKVPRQQQEVSKYSKGSSSALQDGRIAKMVNVERREEAETKEARAIYACGIPCNMVLFPCCQDMVKAINTTLQGFKGPNYENLQTDLLKKEEFVEDILAPIPASCSTSRVSILLDELIYTRHRRLINIIVTSPKTSNVF